MPGFLGQLAGPALGDQLVAARRAAGAEGGLLLPRRARAGAGRHQRHRHLRMADAEQDRREAAHRQPDDMRLRDAEMPEHRDRILHREILAIELRVGGDVGRRIAARRIGDAAVFAGEEPHLVLPFPVVGAEFMDEQDGQAGAGLLVPDARAFGRGVGHGGFLRDCWAASCTGTRRAASPLAAPPRRARLPATPAMPRDSTDSSHPLRRLLAMPAFRRLWAVGGIANAMRWVEILVAAIWTFETTHSALAVSMVALMRALPLLLLGAAAGALAEVLDRRRLLMAGQAATCAGALVDPGPRLGRRAGGLAPGGAGLPRRPGLDRGDGVPPPHADRGGRRARTWSPPSPSTA